MRSILCLLFFSLSSFTSNSAAETLKKNCLIKVKYFYIIGIQEIVDYHLVADSKQDCIRKSKSYKENSTPQKVKKKEVLVQWASS